MTTFYKAIRLFFRILSERQPMRAKWPIAVQTMQGLIIHR